MAMSFEHSYNVVLLFSFWHTTTLMQYMLSLLVIYGACLFQGWLHRRQRHRDAQRHSRDELKTWESGSSVALLPADCGQHFVAGAIEEALSISLGFLLMLLLMTFNVGVFITIVAGMLHSRHAFGHQGGWRPATLAQRPPPQSRQDSQYSEFCDP